MRRVLSFILAICIVAIGMGFVNWNVYAQDDVVVGEQPYITITLFVTEDDLEDEHHIDVSEYLGKQITAYADTDYRIFHIVSVHEEYEESAGLKIFVGGTAEINGETVDLYEYVVSGGAITGAAITGAVISYGRFIGKESENGNVTYKLLYNGVDYEYVVGENGTEVFPKDGDEENMFRIGYNPKFYTCLAKNLPLILAFQYLLTGN